MTDLFPRPFRISQWSRQSTDVVMPYTQTCQAVWLRPSQDPLVGKAQAQRGLFASQLGIVSPGHSSCSGAKTLTCLKLYEEHFLHWILSVVSFFDGFYIV